MIQTRRNLVAGLFIRSPNLFQRSILSGVGEQNRPEESICKINYCNNDDQNLNNE
jgi:hypothetical protein